MAAIGPGRLAIEETQHPETAHDVRMEARIALA
jgi:hypothetical protein